MNKKGSHKGCSFFFCCASFKEDFRSIMWDWAEDGKIAEAFSQITVFEKVVIIVWTVLPLLRGFFDSNLLKIYEDWIAEIIKITPAISYMRLDYILDLSKLADVLPWMVFGNVVIRFSGQDGFKHAFQPPKLPAKMVGRWVDAMFVLFFAVAAAFCVYFPVYDSIKQNVADTNFLRSINITIIHQIQVTFLFYYSVRAVIGKILMTRFFSSYSLHSSGICAAFFLAVLAFAFAHDFTASYVALMIPMEALYLILMIWFGNIWVPIAVHSLFDVFAYFFIT